MTALTVPDGPKMLRETCCVAQMRIGLSIDVRAREHIARLQRVIDECDRQRPLGPDGKHGDRHTATCGCDRVAASNVTDTAVLTLHLPMPAHIAADVILAVVNALAGHDLDGVMDVDEAGRPVITARPSGPDQP